MTGMAAAEGGGAPPAASTTAGGGVDLDAFFWWRRRRRRGVVGDRDATARPRGARSTAPRGAAAARRLVGRPRWRAPGGRRRRRRRRVARCGGPGRRAAAPTGQGVVVELAATLVPLV